MDRRKFFTLGLIGITGTSLLHRNLYATQSSLDTNLAGSIYYSKQKTGRWKGKEAGHIPLVEVGSDMLKITTPHEMNGYEHYINKHAIFDSQFNFLDENMFDPTSTKAPISEHEIKDYKGTVFVVSVCNKHDCWVTEASV